MANELQWYSAMNLDLVDTSTTERRCASILFAIKQLLTQGAMGALYGPLGAPPAAAAATVISSSDGVTAGAGDRWTDVSKVVRGASSGAAHSWSVLKLGDYYIVIDWPWISGSTQVYTGQFAISKNAPTGGTTTARPTATDEASSSNTQMFTTATAAGWTGGRAHLTVAQSPTGQWQAIIVTSQNGSAEFTGAFGLLEKKNSHASDQFKGVLLVEGVVNSGASNKLMANFAAHTASGSPFTGRSLNNTAAVRYGLAERRYAGTQWQAQWGSDEQTGRYHRLPIELGCITTGYRGRDGGGTFYDIHEIHDADHGSTYPAVGDMESMAVGNLLVPFTAPPTI